MTKSRLKSLNDRDKKKFVYSQENLDIFQKLVLTSQEILISIGLNSRDPQA